MTCDLRRLVTRHHATRPPRSWFRATFWGVVALALVYTLVACGAGAGAGPLPPAEGVAQTEPEAASPQGYEDAAPAQQGAQQGDAGDGAPSDAHANTSALSDAALYASEPAPGDAGARWPDDLGRDAPAETADRLRVLAPGRDGFARSAPGELTRVVTRAEEGRQYTNAPWPFRSGAPTELVVYLTPNGNTVEQTLGRARREDESFRFDIQHVLAQVRLYRTLVPDRNVVLRVLEAPRLSWPTWVRGHRDAGARARKLLLTPPEFAPNASIALAAHSGGGTVIFALLEHVAALPHNVEKIALLDSNYAFDAKLGHADKLKAWLRRDPARRLLSVAYDDRNIVLNGKRVVADDGGSYRATFRMLEAFRAGGVVLAESQYHAHQRFRADGARLPGQIDLFVHPNPHNRILHSGLVSDENGLLFALGQGRGETVESKTPYHGPRLYTRFIDRAP